VEVDLNKTNLHYYIKTYDDVLPNNVLSSLTNIVKNHYVFKQACVAAEKDNALFNVVDTSIRNVEQVSLQTFNESSLTSVHWCNFMLNQFRQKFNTYISTVDPKGFTYRIESLDLLKYKPGGFYKFHTDHGTVVPRTLSAIYLINDDYEGGNLIFGIPGSDQILKIERVKNRMIVWPSNFLYPHTVEPIIKGTRYSMVSWAL